VCVTDNGRGFSRGRASVGRLGMATMRERAEAIGGQLHIVSRPGLGTCVEVHWEPVS